MTKIGVENLQRLLAIEGSLTKRPKWTDENAHRATRFYFQIADRNIARLKAEGRVARAPRRTAQGPVVGVRRRGP